MAGISVLLPLLIPVNGRLENAVNRALPSRLDHRLVLVGIDKASLRDYGRPEVWPPELYAAALGTLANAGIRAVALDSLPGLPTSATLGRLTHHRPPLVLATAHGAPPSPFMPQSGDNSGISVLNAPSFSAVREVQTAYPAPDTTLTPSFARQVAALLASPLPLGTSRHLIRYAIPANLAAHTLSFRDVVNGHVRFGALQGRVAVIGLTARGLGQLTLPDVDGRLVSATALQVRAISSLLVPPLRRLPPPLTMLACLLAAALALTWRGWWGFVVAWAALLLTPALWHWNIVFPGVTVSFAALSGTALVAFEQWWAARLSGTRDPLTGFGNHLAFTRAIEQRWRGHPERPVGLLLIDLDNLRQVRELHGRLRGEEALKALAARLQEKRRRGDLTFRWDNGEFAVLLGGVTPQGVSAATQHYGQGLRGVTLDGLPLEANVGAAITAPGMAAPADLIDAASRSRYRAKFQRERQTQVPLTKP
ncbi:diguanylate cyclase [Deinococcus cavernae]|uniref:Diguanylate cyclase n=1 Tax=Deinococcus cavernae TaxID=2320857 RepID=A0A418VBI6_9DEIO|nr:diguanylate cyclase [Deinococcus cavernae]